VPVRLAGTAPPPPKPAANMGQSSKDPARAQPYFEKKEKQMKKRQIGKKRTFSMTKKSLLLLYTTIEGFGDKKNKFFHIIDKENILLYNSDKFFFIRTKK